MDEKKNDRRNRLAIKQACVQLMEKVETFERFVVVANQYSENESVNCVKRCPETMQPIN